MARFGWIVLGALFVLLRYGGGPVTAETTAERGNRAPQEPPLIPMDPITGSVTLVDHVVPEGYVQEISPDAWVVVHGAAGLRVGGRLINRGTIAQAYLSGPITVTGTLVNEGTVSFHGWFQVLPGGSCRNSGLIWGQRNVFYDPWSPTLYSVILSRFGAAGAFLNEATGRLWIPEGSVAGEFSNQGGALAFQELHLRSGVLTNGGSLVAINVCAEGGGTLRNEAALDASILQTNCGGSVVNTTQGVTHVYSRLAVHGTLENDGRLVVWNLLDHGDQAEWRAAHAASLGTLQDSGPQWYEGTEGAARQFDVTGRVRSSGALLVKPGVATRNFGTLVVSGPGAEADFGGEVLNQGRIDASGTIRVLPALENRGRLSLQARNPDGSVGVGRLVGNAVCSPHSCLLLPIGSTVDGAIHVSRGATVVDRRSPATGLVDARGRGLLVSSEDPLGLVRIDESSGDIVDRLPGAPQSVAELDQYQIARASGSRRIDRDHTVVQTFVAGRTGRLTGVGVNVHAWGHPATRADLVLEVLEMGGGGRPTPSVLLRSILAAEQVAPASGLPLLPGQVTATHFDLGAGVPVQEGQRLALRLSSQADTTGGAYAASFSSRTAEARRRWVEGTTSSELGSVAYVPLDPESPTRMDVWWYGAREIWPPETRLCEPAPSPAPAGEWVATPGWDPYGEDPYLAGEMQEPLGTPVPDSDLQFQTFVWTEHRSATPGALAVTRDRRVVVALPQSDGIVEYDADTGEFLRSLVPLGSGGLENPAGLAIGTDGSLLVVVGGGDRVLRYDGDSGAPRPSIPETGLGSFATFGPIAVGPDGDVYVAGVGVGFQGVLRLEPQSGQERARHPSAQPLDGFATFGRDRALYLGRSGDLSVWRIDPELPGSSAERVAYEDVGGPDVTVDAGDEPILQLDVHPQRERGQSLTVGRSGLLSRIEFDLESRAYRTDLHVEIRRAQPVGSGGILLNASSAPSDVLLTTTIPWQELEARWFNRGWVSLDLDSPLPVGAGDRLAVLLRVDASAGNWAYYWYAASADVHSPGTMLYRWLPDGAWEASPNGWDFGIRTVLQGGGGGDGYSSGVISPAGGLLAAHREDGRVVSLDLPGTGGATEVVGPSVLGRVLGIVMSPGSDDDGDGITYGVDPAVATPSDRFEDVGLGGRTRGQILDRGDQRVLVANDLVGGVALIAEVGGGVRPARVAACPLASGGWAVELSLQPGDAVLVTQGSAVIEVLEGTVDLRCRGAEERTAVASVPAGSTLVFAPEAFSFSAPPENSAKLEVTTDEGTITLAPGKAVVGSIEMLIDRLQARIDSVTAGAGARRSLQAKATEARRLLLDGDVANDASARGPLGALGNEIRAQRAKQLTAQDADGIADLLSALATLLDAMGVGAPDR